ncbi:MAG TPA: hypothetical protein DD490_03090 [Acidobacteria bacterium]|nr:hypothetical protein [Acidobacteriota bacterium]
MRGFKPDLHLFLPALALALAASPALAGVNWWTPVGPEGGTATSLVIDPATRILYAAANGSVFASSDGGTTWERRNRGLQDDVRRLAAASTPTPALYAASLREVYRSADGGASWTSTHVENLLLGGLDALAVDPSDSATILVGSLSRGEILRSTDGGANWSRVSQNLACGGIHSLQKGPEAATWYAGCASGQPTPFLKSTDAGATWTPAGSPLPQGGSHLQVVPDPGLGGVLYASAVLRWITRPEWAVYKTTDAGATWTFLTESSGPLVAGPAGQLFAGTLRSTDNGASWQPLGLPAAPGALAFDPAEPATYFAGLPAGIYRTTDDAATWSLHSRGLFATQVATLEIAPDSTLYAWVPGLGLRKKPAGATRWRRADNGLPLDAIAGTFPGPPALAIDPATPAHLFLGWSSGFARSADGGASWTTPGAADGPCLRIRELALDPRDPGRLYAAGWLFEASCLAPGRSCPVFFSEDGGASWTCAGDERLGYVTALVVDSSSQPSRLYATSLGEGLWTSADRGRTWRQLKGLRRFGDTLLTVTVDPRNPLQLYVGDLYGGLYKSTDRGATWAAFNRGLPRASVRNLLVDPQRPQTVYANSSGEGVYVSGNGGRTWFPLNGGLASSPGELLLDPRNPRKLYATTYRNGIYAHERR